MKIFYLKGRRPNYPCPEFFIMKKKRLRMTDLEVLLPFLPSLLLDNVFQTNLRT